MPATSDLAYKLEAAVLAWLASATHGQTLSFTNRYHADATDAYALPCHVVLATVEAEHLQGSGHYRCGVEVVMITASDDTTATAANTEWTKVRAILNWDELATRLSDLADFHCWIVIRDKGESFDKDDRHQTRIYGFTAICQAADNS